MSYKKIQDVKDLKGKRVLVRADYNVPVADGVVVDDYRIRKSLPTVEFLKNAGAKIILISHIESGSTLRPVFDNLQKHFRLTFCEDCLDDHAAIDEMKEGDVILCENVRLYSGEKTNDADFAKKLASLAGVYVNDAFPVSHRKHASVCRITEFLPSYAGLLFQSEVEHLSISFNPPHPFLFILGGAKFDTKIPLIVKFIDRADKVFVGGALAHNFFKELGREIGASFVSEGNFDLVKLYETGKIILPIDTVVEKNGERTAKRVAECEKTDVMLDNGPETLKEIEEAMKDAKFILWNGPLGNYESGYKEGTLKLATLIAESGAKTVVGGGDTLATIAELKIEDKFTFVSTAGGAMLDFLANGTLPGIECLDKGK